MFSFVRKLKHRTVLHSIAAVTAQLAHCLAYHRL